MLPKICLETVARLINETPSEYDYKLAEAILYRHNKLCPKTRPIGDFESYLNFCNFYPEDYVIACWLYLRKDDKGKDIHEVNFGRLTKKVRKILDTAKRLSKLNRQFAS